MIYCALGIEQSSAIELILLPLGLRRPESSFTINALSGFFEFRVLGKNTVKTNIAAKGEMNKGPARDLHA